MTEYSQVTTSLRVKKLTNIEIGERTRKFERLDAIAYAKPVTQWHLAEYKDEAQRSYSPASPRISEDASLQKTGREGEWYAAADDNSYNPREEARKAHEANQRDDFRTEVN